MTDILRLDGSTYVNFAGLVQNPANDSLYTWKCSLDDLNTQAIFGDTRYFVKWRGAPNNDWHVRIGNSNSFVLPYTPSIGEELTCSLDVNGAPGGSATFTVNGNAVAVTVNGSASTTIFRFGNLPNFPGEDMRGYVRDFLWYDTDKSTVLHSWPVDEGSGTVITDNVGTRDGSIVGNANWESLGAAAGFLDINDLSGVWLPGQSGAPPVGASANYQREFAYGRGGIR